MKWRLLSVLTIATTGITAGAYAQDPDRDRDHDRDRVEEHDRVARLDPGTVIPVRLNESIDADKGDRRVYNGTVDQDVRGDNGRLVVPRGATVELMVRYARDNDLNLDLESIVVDGRRYSVASDEKHMDAQRDNSLVGTIVGALDGGSVSGRAVRIPRDSVVTFRLARPLMVGAPDRGEMRDGYHYHDDDPDPR